MAALPFHRSDFALKGPAALLSGDSEFPKMGTKDAQITNGAAARNHSNPELSVTCDHKNEVRTGSNTRSRTCNCAARDMQWRKLVFERDDVRTK